MNYPVRCILYLAVIAMAPALRDPWMVTTQAALGGLMLGVRLEQWHQNRWSIR